jgi:hypothetical protein
MSDIVERLNRGEGCLEEGGKTCISMDAENGCLCAIAADEITRLTAEVERRDAALRECEAELNAYYRMEYAGDHPYSQKKLAQAMASNPATVALKENNT